MYLLGIKKLLQKPSELLFDSNDPKRLFLEKNIDIPVKPKYINRFAYNVKATNMNSIYAC